MIKQLPLNAELITDSLTTKMLGRTLFCLDVIDSTNDEARRIGLEAVDGTVITCEQQTAGRGRLGRSWVSPWGKGIWLTVILKPVLPVSVIPLLTQVAAAAVSLAVENILGPENEQHGVQIKWPNDILLNNRKIGGILTEMQLRGDRVQYAALGIGLNIHSDGEDFPDELKDKAGSLYMLTGKTYSREIMIAEILNELEPLYEEWTRNGALGRALSICRQKSAVIGRPVALSGPGGVQEGLVLGLGTDGELILRLKDGREQSVISGEISLAVVPDNVINR